MAWIVPEYKNGRALWRFASNLCTPLVQAKQMEISKSERVITSNNGGYFGIYSADNIDSVRSEAFHLVVGDEAARIADEGWNDAVRPTLADYDGEEILISTPKGKNWFYYEFMRGQAESDGYKSWTAPSSANPLPNIRKAYEMARRRVPERTFLQEWDAQFIDDGVLFRNIMKLATLAKAEPVKDNQYVIGADWGRTNDATVFSVMNINTREQVYLDRMTDTDFYSQRIRLKALSERYNNANCIVETNSIGRPQMEELQRMMGASVMGFETTNSTKAAIINGMQLAFEQEAIHVINDPVQVSELMAYQSERLPSGLIRFGAPEGMHDDCVIALALSWHGAASVPEFLPENPFYS